MGTEAQYGGLLDLSKIAEGDGMKLHHVIAILACIIGILIYLEAWRSVAALVGSCVLLGLCAAVRYSDQERKP